MKEWLKEWLEIQRESITRNQLIFGGVIFIVLFSVGIVVGFGYSAIICVFSLLYYFSNQASSENIITPREKEEIMDEIAELEDEKEYIMEHLNENPSDIEAKMLLRNVDKKIEELKDLINFEE